MTKEKLLRQREIILYSECMAHYFVCVFFSFSSFMNTTWKNIQLSDKLYIDIDIYFTFFFAFISKDVLKLETINNGRSYYL